MTPDPVARVQAVSPGTRDPAARRRRSLLRRIDHAIADALVRELVELDRDR